MEDVFIIYFIDKEFQHAITIVSISNIYTILGDNKLISRVDFVSISNMVHDINHYLISYTKKY